MEREHSAERLSDEAVRAMEGHARLEYFRGAVPDYSSRLDRAVESGDYGPHAAAIREAFEQRVEAYLFSWRHAGDALDHLSQVGVMVATEAVQNRLAQTAAALAAKVMEDAGHARMADEIYADLGRMASSQYA